MDEKRLWELEEADDAIVQEFPQLSDEGILKRMSERSLEQRQQWYWAVCRKQGAAGAMAITCDEGIEALDDIARRMQAAATIGDKGTFNKLLAERDEMAAFYKHKIAPAAPGVVKEEVEEDVFSYPQGFEINDSYMCCEEVVGTRAMCNKHMCSQHRDPKFTGPGRCVVLRPGRAR